MSDDTYKGSSPSSILRSKHVQERLRKLAEAIEKGEPPPPPSHPDIAPVPADGGRDTPSPVSDTRPAGGTPVLGTTEPKP